MRRVISAYALSVFLCCGAFAQVFGNLNGLVVDPTGAAIPGSKVDLYLAGGQAPVISVQTNESGEFHITSLRPATYDIRVQSGGFTDRTIANVVIDPARDNTVPPIRLELASATQTVEVQESVQAVQSNSFDVSTTITQEQVDNLPVLDRQVSNLFLTQAGVSEGKGPATVNGLRTSLTNLTLDGVNIQDNFIRTNGLDFLPNKLTIGQVAEMTINTSNANPSFGLGASQISLITPSGTNVLHGNGYWYNRNSALAANNWFNNQAGVEKPFLNLNQLGGSIGGPIIKDKLFFYTNYEAYRLRQSTLTTNTVLTPSAREGILTYVDAGGVQRQFNILQAQHLSVDPAIQTLLTAMPTTINSTQQGDGLNTGGYAFNARSNETRDNVTGRVDYYLSLKHILSGSYIWNRDLVDRPDIGNFYTHVPPVTNDDHSHFLSASWRWNPTPRLTNELRGGFNIAPAAFQTSGKLPAYLIDNAPFSNLDPLLFTSPVNTFLPQGRATNTYSLQDNASYTRGRHTISFGFQGQWIRTNPYDYAGIVPTYGLSISANSPYGFNVGDIPGASATDTNTANLLLANLGGLVSDDQQVFNVASRTSGFVAGAPNRRHYTYDTFSGYVSDTWKMSRRLSLTLGLRYDYYTVFNERDSLELLPVLTNNNVESTLLSNATLNFAGSSVGRPFYRPDRNNFAPSVGFAWDVFGNGRTAIRGGYSLAYVNDDTISTLINNIDATNSGLSGTAVNTGLTGTASSLPGIGAPPFQVPRTFADNYAINPTNAQGMPDPNLRTPYVQQWSFGVQQEVKGFILEGRYVGNHATKGLRAFDYNQVIISQNGFLNDFKRARNNGFLSSAAGKGFNPDYDPTVGGSQPLTVFPQLVAGGLLDNPFIQGLISSGEVGALAADYQIFGLNGGVNFFRNPYTLGANAVNNFSSTTYNALQLDVRRRTRAGLQFQFNYTFSKALGNSAGDGQVRFEPFLDNANPALERARLPFDLTHVFKANFYVPLPFGPGKRFSYAPLNRVIGGWGISSFITYQSGNDFSVLSARGTLNRSGLRSALNTVDTSLTKGELDKITGFFMTGNGPMFISPNVIGPDGRGVAPDGSAPFDGQVFFNPGPGEVGSLQRRYFNGPWDFNWDFAIIKNTKITERQSVELRADFFDLTNHAAFSPGDEGLLPNFFDVNQPNFGKLTQFAFQNQSRVIQFGLYYRF
ncbi:MAG: TonB-dependent receptor [Bryobacteraceae bacterium]